MNIILQRDNSMIHMVEGILYFAAQLLLTLKGTEMKTEKKKNIQA